MFGGNLEWGGDSIAETTILRFGEGIDTRIAISCSRIIVKVLEFVLRVQKTVPTHHPLLLY